MGSQSETLKFPDENGYMRVWRPALPVKPWRGPKLTEKGKPFRPTGTKPGATVEWVDVNSEKRQGQVWSAGPEPKSVWVVPFRPWEGEGVVLLRERQAGPFWLLRAQRPAHIWGGAA